MKWLILAQLELGLFVPQHPITNAYEKQVGKDVIVTITYENQTPKDVCVILYDIGDQEMSNPIATRCVEKPQLPGNWLIWPDSHIDTLGNMEVVVRYPDGKIWDAYLYACGVELECTTR